MITRISGIDEPRNITQPERGIRRYGIMDSEQHSKRALGRQATQRQAIHAPNVHEGVGNALRSAYGRVPGSLPPDWQSLLSKLDC
jgi:hypothetical protein